MEVFQKWSIASLFNLTYFVKEDSKSSIIRNNIEKVLIIDIELNKKIKVKN